MNSPMNHKRMPPKTSYPIITMGLVALLLSGCPTNEEPAPPVVRAVRSEVVEMQDVGDPIVVTGHLRARDEVSLSFRISGKLLKRSADVGDTVTSGQTVALLDPEVERNTRNAAQANLLAAQAVLEQSAATEERQRQLLKGKVMAADEYDRALRQLKTAKAQVDAAEATLKSAEELLGYTELKAEVSGVITQKGAESGEVVQAGQMVLTVAQHGGRDAVFDMPAQLIREGLSLGQQVEVWLADSHEITTTGTIREISPQADPITRNHQVKVGLVAPPQGMFLGATVVGRLRLQIAQRIEIPSAALTMLDSKPAVWVIDSNDRRVHLRQITIARYTPDSIVVTDGLIPGERIATAGVQELHEGQIVKLLGDPS